MKIPYPYLLIVKTAEGITTYSTSVEGLTYSQALGMLKEVQLQIEREYQQHLTAAEYKAAATKLTQKDVTTAEEETKDTKQEQKNGEV